MFVWRKNKNHKYPSNETKDKPDNVSFGDALGEWEDELKGGWIEEVWYSYYRIGICYMNLGKPFDAIGYWMEGFNYYPNRIENLYEIVKYYREKGNHKSAKVYYDLAKNILSNKLNIDNLNFLIQIYFFFNNIKINFVLKQLILLQIIYLIKR